MSENGNVHLATWVPQDIDIKVRVAAAKQGKSKAAWLLDAVNEKLRRETQNTPKLTVTP